MYFARTRAKKLIVRFCVIVNLVNVIQKAMLRLSRILSEITVISRCPISWMLVISACVLGLHCLPVQHLEQPLFENASLWQNPCNVRSYHESNTNKTKAISPKEREVFLNRIKESITRTMQEINQITDNHENTDWNTAQNQDRYKFLKSYKKNQTTWERQVQIYLASIEVIYKMQVEIEKPANSNDEQSSQLKVLRGKTRNLLCDIQEYRNNSKNRMEKHHSGISAKQMNNKINFTMTGDLTINMDLHKHFLKCRFQCFLKDMEHHVNSLIEKLKKDRPTRKVRTTKKPRRKPKKGHNRRNGLKNKCCIVNNMPTSPTTPRPPVNGVHKVNNNKKKLNASQQSKLIKPNQKKVQRKGNKKSVQ